MGLWIDLFLDFITDKHVLSSFQNQIGETFCCKVYCMALPREIKVHVSHSLKVCLKSQM